MNKIKYLYIILLSVLFINNNIMPMEQPGYIEVDQETSPLLRFPEELIVHIINQAIIEQVKETINNWNDIFNEPSLKINLQEIKGLIGTSTRLHNLFNSALTSISLKKYLRNYLETIKQKRFKELFEQLKTQSIEQYKGLSKEQLNQQLVNMLNQDEISKEDFKAAVKLILAGADVNAKDEDGTTALMYASLNGHKEIVEILIEADANVDIQNQYGDTALIWACEKKHADIVEMLIKKSTAIETKDITMCNTALIIASCMGHKEIVEILIENGADANAKDKHGRTTLIRAKDNKEIVEMLIKAGTTVNVQDNFDNTALMYACQNGYKEIVEMLIKAGSDINAENQYGKTALSIAEEQGHKDIVQLLQSLEKTNNFYSCLLF